MVFSTFSTASIQCLARGKTAIELRFCGRKTCWKCHCFFSNRVFWLNSWLCFCLTILPSCSKSQVCKRRRLQSGSCRTGAFEMRCPLVFHGFSMFFFHRFKDSLSLNDSMNKYVSPHHYGPSITRKAESNKNAGWILARDGTNLLLDHSWFSCLHYFEKEDALQCIIKIFP